MDFKLSLLGNVHQPENKPGITMEDAEFDRSYDFWAPLCKVIYSGAGLNDVDQNELHKTTKSLVMDLLSDGIKAFAQGECETPDCRVSRATAWLILYFILAFDVEFTYDVNADIYPSTPEEDLPDAIDCTFCSDRLEEEGALQAKLAEMLDDYIVEGAALAKKIGSDSYTTWKKALIELDKLSKSTTYITVMKGTILRLGETYNIHDEAKGVIENIMQAQLSLWADLHIWKRMNRSAADNASKEPQPETSR